MCILYVLDINDIRGGYAEDIISKVNEKELDYLLVINKIDTLPKDINPFTLKTKLISILNSNKVKLNNLVI